MDFVTIEGRALKRALRPLLETVCRRNKLPILSYIKLSLSASGLKLEATDLDVAASVEIDVIDGSGEWSSCLPAHALSGIAGVAGVMPIRIEPDAGTAALTLGENEAAYRLGALPAADFPDGIIQPGVLLERFGNGRLGAMLDKVRAFISREETRYYLNGVCWQRGSFGSRFVATDGHRLAICTYDREAFAEPVGWIIPRKTTQLIVNHLAGRDVMVRAAADGKLGLMFSSDDGLHIATKLIDGTYPDVDRVVPADGPFLIELKRTEALAAFTRLTALGPDRGRAIRFENADSRVSLHRKSHDGGARASTSAAWPEGLQPFGFNGCYLTEVVAGCEGDVALGISDPGAPVIFRDADPAMTRVLMPMRV